MVFLFAAIAPLLDIWRFGPPAVIAGLAFAVSALFQWRGFLRLKKTALFFEDGELLLMDGRRPLVLPESAIRCTPLAVALGIGFGGRIRRYQALDVNARLLLIDLSSGTVTQGTAGKPALPLLPLEGADYAVFRHLAETRGWIGPSLPPAATRPAGNKRWLKYALALLLTGCTALLAFAPNRRIALAGLFGLLGAAGWLYSRRSGAGAHREHPHPP
jgi:hypothetical protein